jgi:hypothetical protein
VTVSKRSICPGNSDGRPTAGNKFRETFRSTENPTTKLLGEGGEAIKELNTDLDKARR